MNKYSLGWLCILIGGAIFLGTFSYDYNSLFESETVEEFEKARNEMMTIQGLGLVFGSPILMLGCVLLQSCCDEHRFNKMGKRRYKNVM